ncbi:YfhO family protein [Pacificibacter marinus]|nr:YfhO family protein [Pacificibacter marinus]
MSKISSKQYALFLIGVIVVLGGIVLAKGALYVDRYEVDVAHLIDIVLRINMGQVPHIDISTPLGIAAFYPIVMFTKLGFGVGMAFASAQILVAVFLLPIVIRVGLSRLSGVSAWLFGLVSMSMVLALVYGADVASQSASMYYNRWAWAFAFSATFLAAMPAHKGMERPRLDGVFIGVMVAVLALLKSTFFIAFAPVICVVLMMRGAWRTLAYTLLSGGIVALAVLAIFGVDLYVGYVRDLLSVVHSPTRAAPGVDLIEMLNGPRFFTATATLLLSIVVLRQSGQGRAGLVLMLLVPSFVYVTYQNYGNDPKWLLFLCLYLMAHRPQSGVRVMFNAQARNATTALALVCFALGAPSFQNMITSPLRHFSEDVTGYQLQLDNTPLVRDVWVYSDRVLVLRELTPVVDRLPALADYGKALYDPVIFFGQKLPRCQIDAGDAVMQAYMADRLKEAPFGFGPEAQFFVTDMFSMTWMAGGFTPLQGGAPWYYSGTPGLENADAIVIPLCPLNPKTQAAALAAIEATGVPLEPVIRDEVMWVYKIKK